MTEPEVFMLSEEALTDVVKQIKPDQWALPIPEWFAVGRSEPNMTLRKIVNYHAYDDAWVPDVLAGKTAYEVGNKYEGDLLGDDPKGHWDAIQEKALAAVRQLDDLDQTVHLSYGDYPAREYLKHIAYFRGIRSYDIAKLIGVDTTMPDQLVEGLWEMLAPDAEEWRKMGVFGPKVQVPEDAPLQDRLLGLVGRQP